MRHPRRRANDPDVDALLRDVAKLRLTLDADLTVAAAAAEADRFDVAAEIVEKDSDELRAFAAASAERLAARADDPVPGPRRPRRLRFALAAAPAMLTAAAVIAAVGFVGNNGGTTQQASQPHLVASYSALTELAKTNTDPNALVQVGLELNQSVAQLVAQAPHNAASARQALRILIAEESLLTTHHPDGAPTLLAQARALIEALQQSVPSTVLNGATKPLGHATPPVTETGLLPPTAVLPHPTHSSAPASPTPAPAGDQPTPQPSAGGTTAPSSSASPVATDPWPFDTLG